jgi:hypothetical protein
MTERLTIRPVFDEGFADLVTAIHTASKLDLPEAVLDRLHLLCKRIGDVIGYGDVGPATKAGEIDLPIVLQLPVADTVFLAALRAGDVGAICHLVGPSVGVSTIPTVSVGGIGVTADPAYGGTA